MRSYRDGSSGVDRGTGIVMSGFGPSGESHDDPVIVIGAHGTFVSCARSAAVRIASDHGLKVPFTIRDV